MASGWRIVLSGCINLRRKDLILRVWLIIRTTTAFHRALILWSIHAHSALLWDHSLIVLPRQVLVQGPECKLLLKELLVSGIVVWYCKGGACLSGGLRPYESWGLGCGLGLGTSGVRGGWDWYSSWVHQIIFVRHLRTPYILMTMMLQLNVYLFTAKVFPHFFSKSLCHHLLRGLLLLTLASLGLFHILEFSFKAWDSRASVIIKLWIEDNLVCRCRSSTAASLLIRMNSNIVCHVAIDVAVPIRHKSWRGRPTSIVITIRW